ncbi:MAG: tetratricopeptide repeat protein [Candidatus Aminicenantes bacterium]
MKNTLNKMTGRLIGCIYFGLFLLSAALPLTSVKVLNDQQWREDLQFLAEKVAQEHRNPFDHVSAEVFWKEVEKLDRQIPLLEDHEIIVGMARLVSLIHDGHTRLTLPLDPEASTGQSHTQTKAPEQALQFHFLPLRLYLYSDGLHVQEATPEFKEIVGARVIKVGNKKAEEALEAVRPVVHYDSDMWFKLIAPSMLTIQEVLHAQNLCESKEEASFVFQTKTGQEKKHTFKALDSKTKIQWISANEESQNPLPLYLKNREENFWFEYLPDEKLMYVQVNSIRDKKDETIAQFSKRLFESVNSCAVEKLVLDLRQNGGGNNYLNRPLVLSLIQSDKVNQYGKLFTIIGRRTFSAAMNLVTDIEKWTQVIFVGEPTGNAPSHYGDSRKFVLPHCRLTARISSVYWRDWSVDEKRPWVAPDIKVGLSSEEYAANQDPVLDTIISYKAPETLYRQLKEKIEMSGIEAAVFHYYKFRYSPRTSHIKAEKDLIKVGDYLMDQGEFKEAGYVYLTCARDYPDSLKAHLGLGKVYLNQNNKKQAIETLKKTLMINPESREAKELLQRAQALK